MNNHSDIWKNITMIIFFVILLIFILILLIKFKVNIYLEFKGTKSYVKINFLFFEIKRKGSFFIRKKNELNSQSGSEKFFKCSQNKKRKAIKIEVAKDIKSKRRETKKDMKNKKSKKFSYKKLINNRMPNNKYKFILSFFVMNVKRLRFDKLEIYEEVGTLEPNLTALAVPVISTLTTLPLNLLNINYNKFKYKVIPAYTDLKFNLILKTQISFRLVNIFYSIITEKMRKLFLLDNKNR